MKRPRAKGNLREDRVVTMFASAGRYSIVRRASGAVSDKRKSEQPIYIAGDVIVLPRGEEPGIQIEVGGPGKAALKEFEDLERGAIPGYRLGVVLFLPRGRERWLLWDGLKSSPGYTECVSVDDFLGTISGRREIGQ